ncbi:MAG: hypothetical protein H6528_11325 [Actinobacteria bacterium]|nr:hypothetical protein [Actinomycetota bacterium]
MPAFVRATVAALCSVLLVMAAPVAARADDGTLNTAFLAATGTGFNSAVTDLLVQPDGKLVAVGNFTDFNGEPRSGIARLNPDGSLDTTFQPGTGFIGGVPLAVARQSGGSLIVVGNFTEYDGDQVKRIVRIKADGSRDTMFTPTAGGFGNSVSDVAVDSSDRIVVVGPFIALADGVTVVNGIARFSPDGVLDAGFQTATGTAFPFPLTMPPRSVDVSADRIVVAGDFEQFNGSDVAYVVQLDNTGALDPVFAANLGLNVDAQADRAVFEPDGQIVVSGDFNASAAPLRSNSCDSTVTGRSTPRSPPTPASVTAAPRPSPWMRTAGSSWAVVLAGRRWGSSPHRAAAVRRSARHGFVVPGAGPDGFVNAVAAVTGGVCGWGFEQISGTNAGGSHDSTSTSPASSGPDSHAVSEPLREPVPLPLKVKARKARSR